MSTQIFIQGQEGCTTDSMLIASASAEVKSGDNTLHISSIRGWNSSYLSRSVDIQVGFVPVAINADFITNGIPLPRELSVGDVITLCGTAILPKGTYVQLSELRLMVGIYYLNCSEPIQNIGDPNLVDLSRIVSTTLFPFEEIASKRGKACFTIEHNVDKLYAGCDTLVYLLFGIQNIVGGAGTGGFGITYTFTNERNCLALDITPYLRIQSCCDQTVEEVIVNSDLSVGQVFVDTEGNCWEVIEKTADPITGSRIVDTTYETCVQCKIANPCPSNIVVSLCCTGGIETFTASLPGINVGDVFVDIYGICYRAEEETGSPITGYVTVDTNYGPVNCEDCTTINECPTFISLIPCCGQIGKIAIVTTDTILGYNPFNDEVIVDTFGVCYRKTEYNPGFGSVNAPFIQYASSYGINNCETCKTANPCDPLYYTLIDCCNGDTEVILIDTGGAVIGPDTIIQISLTSAPLVQRCFKVISYSNTGTVTSVLNNFYEYFNDCIECRFEPRCITNYVIQDCCGILPNEVATLSEATLGYGQSFADASGNCWSVVEETTDPATVILTEAYPNCNDCNSTYNNCTLVGLRTCCTTPFSEPIIYGTSSLENIGGGVVIGDVIKDQFEVCWEILEATKANPLNSIIPDAIFESCEGCEPCPNIIYYTVENCCTGELQTFKIDYSSVGFYIPGLEIGNIYSLTTDLMPAVADCWKLIGYNTTGVETITISNFVQPYNPGRCDVCVREQQYTGSCYNYYIVEDCCGIQPNGIMYLPDYLASNNFIVNDNVDGYCWSITTVTTGPANLIWDGNTYEQCDACTGC